MDSEQRIELSHEDNHETLVCGRCGSCFCEAPGAWKREFWENASADLRGRRRSDRPTTPLSLAGQTPARPVILLIDDERIVHSIVSKVLAGFSGTLLIALVDGSLLSVRAI